MYAYYPMWSHLFKFTRSHVYIFIPPIPQYASYMSRHSFHPLFASSPHFFETKALEMQLS